MQKMCGVVWCYAGGADDAQAALAPIRAQLPAALDGVAEMPFPALQSAFDGLYPPGDQWYWRADFVETIPADAIEAHVATRPSCRPGSRRCTSIPSTAPPGASRPTRPRGATATSAGRR